MASEVITLSREGKRFWRTNKPRLTVVITDKPVRCYGAYWSGGSKNDWWTHTKANVTLMLPSVGPAPFDTRPEPEATPDADTAVVQGGVFAGKTAGLRVYVTSKEGWIW